MLWWWVGGGEWGVGDGEWGGDDTVLSAEWSDPRGLWVWTTLWGLLQPPEYSNFPIDLWGQWVLKFWLPRKISGRNYIGFVLICILWGTEFYLVAQADLNFDPPRALGTPVLGLQICPTMPTFFPVWFSFVYCLIIKHLLLARKVTKGSQDRLGGITLWVHLTCSWICSTYLASKQKWKHLS